MVTGVLMMTSVKLLEYPKALHIFFIFFPRQKATVSAGNLKGYRKNCMKGWATIPWRGKRD